MADGSRERNDFAGICLVQGFMYIHASGSKHCLHSFASHVLSQSVVSPA
jgi:hypothetical protein